MQSFREAVESKDIEALVAILADDVVFRSPAVHQPYQGRDATQVILRAVMRVFEDFRYVQQWGEGADQVLLFRARVGNREIEGADFVHTDAEGLVDDLRVMIRPLSGLNAVLAAMQEAIPQVMKELGLPGPEGV